METMRDFLFLGSKIIADGDCSHEIKRCLLLGRKTIDQPRQHIKRQRHYFTNKALSSQSYGFSSCHVCMWQLDHKESWAPKNWCFWTVVLEKTLESPLDCKEIQPVNPEGNQSWIFIKRTDAEAEAPKLWPPDANIRLTGKDPDAGKDWRQEEKGTTEDVMVGWYHWLDGHEFEQVLGVGDGQVSLVWCSSWGCKVLDMTKRLNWTKKAYPTEFFFFLFFYSVLYFPNLFFFIHFCLWWVSIAVWTLPNCSKQGLLFILVHRFSLLMASLVAELGL